MDSGAGTYLQNASHHKSFHSDSDFGTNEWWEAALSVAHGVTAADGVATCRVFHH
jgi:hypothetical protein